MDGSTPFQPWTSAGDRSPRESRAAQYEGSGQLPPPPMDGARAERLQHIVESSLGGEARQQVSALLGQVAALGPMERLLLFLKLPAGASPPDPLKQPLNPLGSRSEIQQTVMWIQTHLEVDPEISLPKQDVYEEYLEYCASTGMKPLSTADFGKVMKQVYPCVKPRRLGTRGNSRYCYAGMRKKIKLEPPCLPDLGNCLKMVEIPAVQNDLLIAASQLIREWAEKLLGIQFGNLCDLACHLVDKSCVESGTAAALLITETLAERGDSEGQSPQQRGVIKELKRKIQAQPHLSQPHLSPGKGRPGKKSKPEAEEEHDGEAAGEGSLRIKSEQATFSYPFYVAPSAPPPPPPPPPPYGPVQPPYGPLQPINLSSSAGYLPIPPTPRRLPMPGKKMILETYNNEVNSPRDYSRPPPPVPASPGCTQYLPKKMRATESFGGKGLASRFAGDAETPKREPDPLPYPTLPVYSSEPDTPAVDARSVELFPPSRTYFNPSPGAAPLAQDPKRSTGESEIYPVDTTVKKNKKQPPPDAVGGVAPRPAQRGRPRKKSLSKAKYTRRRPTQPSAPPACCHDSCSSLTDTINRSGIICAERHSEIFTRERVISISGLDKHALDDYLNEGNSQEHEEELIKYLPQNVDSPLNHSNLKGTFQATDRPLEDEKSSVDNLPREFAEIGQVAAEMQTALNSAQDGDFLNPNSEIGDQISDNLSKMREYLQKNLKFPYNGDGENAPAAPQPVLAVEGSPPQRFSFVPISPTASPFVSPRSTPQQGRRRRHPGLQLRPDTGSFAVPSGHLSFPMSAPPSPTIAASKYRPSCAASVYYGAERCPPLSADPLSREVSQFFPEGGRSQSVPLAEGAPYFGPPDPVPPAVPFASYNNTPCGSVPPTPTPGDFCDFGPFNEPCDSISERSELDPEHFRKICSELSFEEMPVASERRAEEELLMGLELLGPRSVPNTPGPRRPLPPTSREGEGSRSVPCTPGERACFSYSNRDFLINGNSLERDDPPGSGGSPLPLAAFSEDCAPGLPEGDLLADLRNTDFYDM